MLEPRRLLLAPTNYVLREKSKVPSSHLKIFHFSLILYSHTLHFIFTLYTVDATEFVTAQINATFHEGSAECRAVR